MRTDQPSNTYGKHGSERDARKTWTTVSQGGRSMAELAIVALLVVPAALVDVWALSEAWRIVLVPLGAPTLGAWHVWAVAVAIRMLRPPAVHHEHDERTAEKRLTDALAAVVARVVGNVVTVWWLLPWLVSP